MIIFDKKKIIIKIRKIHRLGIKEVSNSPKRTLERISILERSSVEESEALRVAQKQQLVELEEQLQKAAEAKIHATTRKTLIENETLKNSLSILRSNVTKYKRENLQLRKNMKEQQTNEVVTQEVLLQLSNIAEKRALIISTVTKKAEEHFQIYKDYNHAELQKEKLKRDLQQIQTLLDAATRSTCELRENISEKNIALELLTAKLQEEKNEKIKLCNVLHSSLQLLQENIFGIGNSAKLQEKKEVSSSWVSPSVINQLINILSEVDVKENILTGEDSMKNERKEDSSLISYSPGNLGLITKNRNGKN